MKILIAAALGAAISLPALAENHAEVDPERRALLIQIIEDLGCKMDGANPPKAFLDQMEKHKFVKDETKAIAGQMFKDGVAKREGPESGPDDGEVLVMSMRRLHHEQPDDFAFTAANSAWAEQLIAKYPDGRQASAVIPLLWRGQEQEGWVTRPMIEQVASMLGMAEIRVLEVATFYFMFQLQPVGSVAHIQVCGTTSCMICGAEDLVAVCKEKIAPNPHQISADGKFSWEEVECLGACSNAPMAQIGKDYYEDLTTDSLSSLIDRMANGEVPTPGPQNGRWASEPADGLTSLLGDVGHTGNASVDIANQLGDTLKRIDGTDPLPQWNAIAGGAGPRTLAAPVAVPAPEPAEAIEDTAPPASDDADTVAEAAVSEPIAAPAAETEDYVPAEDDKPELLTEARESGPDDLKVIKGIGPKLEKLCNQLGVYHYDQIASWTDKEVAWVDHNLDGFKGRIVRDEWVSQAKLLAAGKDQG